MSKSKALAVAHAPLLALHKDEFSVPLLRINQLHQIARRAGSQMVVAAAVAGLELLGLQRELKKSPSGCTFEQFLSNRRDELGFSRSTAFKYTRVASELKSKLLKAQDGAIIALLDKSPSAMSEREATALAEAVKKSVDGSSLSEVYEELDITRRQHRAPDRGLRTLKNAGDGKPPPMHVPLQQQAQEQLEFIAKFTVEIEKKVKIGREEVLLLATQPVDQIEKLIQIHEHNLELLRAAKQARRGK